MGSAYEGAVVNDQERIRKDRRRARNWAIVIAAVALTFYVGIFFLIKLHY